MANKHVIIRKQTWLRRVNTALRECYPGYPIPLAQWIHDYMKMIGNEVNVEVTCGVEMCLIIITELLNKNGLNEDALVEMDKILNEVYVSGNAGC